MELWKSIPEYDGLYEASDQGNIRTVDGKITSNARYQKRVWRRRVMKQKIHRRGNRADARVELWKDGTHKTWLVSRLVASAWIGLPESGMTVNHINGNPLDNRPENLEWVTLQENISKAYETGLKDANRKPVTLVFGSETYSFPSYAEASRFLSKSEKYVSLCIARGRSPISADGIKYEVAF